MTSSPSPSTIEDVVSPTTTTTIQELTVATPLSASDLEAILGHFKSPVQEPDKESITSQVAFPSGLVTNTSVAYGTPTSHQPIPYTTNISNNEELMMVCLTCAPGGPHCAELNLPCCDICLLYCKEPGGPSNCCFCHQEAEAKPPPPLYIPSGDEVIHTVGAISANPGGDSERSHIPSLLAYQGPKAITLEDDSDEEDYDHHQDPYPVLIIGGANQQAAEDKCGRLVTYTCKGPQNGCNNSPIPPGFMLNIHPTYIPFCLINDQGKEVVAKYVQLFLNNDDPYTYAKMMSQGTTFIGKVFAAPDTDT